MKFNGFKFFRTPPPTVATPAPETSTASTSTSGLATTATNSTAAVLAAKFGDLAGTANYLQSVILSLTKGLAVTVNTAQDPDLGRALTTIYGNVPPAISTQMYSYLLDAELGTQQATLAAGSDATVQVSPYQTQALITSTKAVDSALSDTGEFLAQSALLLRALKTQASVYTEIQAQLALYPAATLTVSTPAADVIQASTVDVGPETASALSDHADAMASTYASAFTALAGVSAVSQDIVCMVNTLGQLGKAELAQVQSLFNLVKSTSVSESVADIANGLTSFVFSSMMTQASGMLFQLDRIGQMALQPLQSMTNSLGLGMSAVQSKSGSSLIGVIRSITQTARVTTGPLAGLIASNSAATSCGTSASNTKANAAASSSATPSPSCNNTTVSGGATTSVLSSGMQELSTLLDWSLQKANAKFSTSLSALTKMMNRTQADTCNQVKLLTMVNNLGTLSSLASAFLAQPGGVTSTASTATTTLAAVGSILASTQSGNQTTYTVQNGTVTVTPPTVPAPTAPAIAVFAKAGIQTSLAGISQAL